MEEMYIKRLNKGEAGWFCLACFKNIETGKRVKS